MSSNIGSRPPSPAVGPPPSSAGSQSELLFRTASPTTMAQQQLAALELGGGSDANASDTSDNEFGYLESSPPAGRTRGHLVPIKVNEPPVVTHPDNITPVNFEGTYGHIREVERRDPLVQETHGLEQNSTELDLSQTSSLSSTGTLRRVPRSSSLRTLASEDRARTLSEGSLSNAPTPSRAPAPSEPPEYSPAQPSRLPNSNGIVAARAAGTGWSFAGISDPTDTVTTDVQEGVGGSNDTHAVADNSTNGPAAQDAEDVAGGGGAVGGAVGGHVGIGRNTGAARVDQEIAGLANSPNFDDPRGGLPYIAPDNPNDDALPPDYIQAENQAPFVAPLPHLDPNDPVGQDFLRGQNRLVRAQDAVLRLANTAGMRDTHPDLALAIEHITRGQNHYGNAIARAAAAAVRERDAYNGMTLHMNTARGARALMERSFADLRGRLDRADQRAYHAENAAEYLRTQNATFHTQVQYWRDLSEMRRVRLEGLEREMNTRTGAERRLQSERDELEAQLYGFHNQLD